MEKLTDNEIIKALEYCVNVKSCNECNKPNPRPCTVIETKDILDLINRQKAEIERLEEMLDSAVSSERNVVDNADYEKSEAIKEFWEKLKKEKVTHKNFGEMIYVEDGNNLVKEMVGE